MKSSFAKLHNAYTKKKKGGADVYTTFRKNQWHYKSYLTPALDRESIVNPKKAGLLTYNISSSFPYA